MDEATVRHAIAQLQAQGEAPSVRKVHRLVGGSHRDISNYLRRLLPAADVGMVTPENAPELPRPVGAIAEAQERCREVDAQAQVLRTQYQAALTRLRALQQAPTPPRHEDLSQCQRDVQELAAGLQAREREVQWAEHHLRELKECATTLANRLPGLRQQLMLAQVEVQEAQQEATRLVEVAQERVAGWAREVQKTQEELARLGGPEMHT
jgi:chromosome segregation ATPase